MLDAAAIAALRQAFDADLAAAASARDVQALRDRYLGRRGGLVTGLFSALSTAPPDARRQLGQLVNELKSHTEGAIASRRATLDLPSAATRVDATLPGRLPVVGHRHPLTLLRERIEGHFARSGYEILDGPETEDDYHNFEALNIPAEHPARDMQDTLYLARPFDRPVEQVGADRPGRVRSQIQARRPATLLRTHTSAMQIRYMSRHEPPVRIICPGRVYRRDNLDQTHTPMFQQVEGLVVGERVTMADLKGTIVGFLRELFEAADGADGRAANSRATDTSATDRTATDTRATDTRAADRTATDTRATDTRAADRTATDTRATDTGATDRSNGRAIDIVFRPTFFPYTEPSADVFVRDAARGPKWLEVLGCGMVHPALFEAVGYDAERYTGFAFGMGIERLAMLLFGVDDIRQFYENDVRFLEQFPQ